MRHEPLSVTLKTVMKSSLSCLLIALLPWGAFAQEGRLYVNDKKAPDSRKDLEAIQKSLIEVRSGSAPLAGPFDTEQKHKR